MDNSTLQIVLQAVDNATATLQKVSDKVNDLSDKIDKNTEASKKGNNAFSDMAKYAEAIGLVKLTDEFIDLTKEAVNFAVETSSAFETSKAQFDVLLGSAQAGSAMMAQLAQYEPNTSFDFSQLTNATQQLLALGVAQKEVIPDMKMLGDISLGNVDHLNHLAYTFGQVKDQTKLSLMQVREFVQGANVDVLQLLTNYLNEHAKAYTNVGTSAKGAAGEVGAAGKINAEEVRKMITAGQVSFDMVKSALEQSTQSGGMYFDAMKKHMDTFSGIMSSVRTQLQQTALDIMGFDMNPNSKNFGELGKGTPFAMMKQDLDDFLMFLRMHKQDIADFFKNGFTMVNDFAIMIMKNKDAVIALAGAFAGIGVGAIMAFVEAFSPVILGIVAFAAAGAVAVTVFNAVIGGISSLREKMIVLGVALTAAVVIAAPLLAAFVALAGGIAYLITQTDMFKTHQDMVTQAHQRATKAADDEKQALQNLKDALKADENASYNLEGAQLAVQHAQKNLSDVTQQYGKDSLEAKDARHQLRGAEDDLASAQQNVNDKMADAKKKLDDEQKAHDEMVKKNKDYVAEIGKQKTAWDDVAGAIKGAWDWLTRYLAPDLNSNYAQSQTKAALALPHKATGTSWFEGGTALVGENGPEIVNLPRGSGVVPNHQVNNYSNRNPNITLGPVYVQNTMDVDSMMRRLSFALRTDSSL